MKKLLVLMLTVVMLFTLGTVAVFASEAEETTVTTETELNNALTNGGNVVLGADINLTEKVSIPNGVSVTLDLNGYTISQEKECTASYEMISNNGSLTITGNGKISFTDTGAGDPSASWGAYTIRNAGTLVVENGTIENLSAQNVAGQAFAHTVFAIFQYSGSCTINGGTISCPSYRSIRLWKGNMTINGGTFEGQIWVQCVDDTAKLTINGGEFTNKGNDASSVFIENENYNAEVAITDGTFNGKVGCSDATGIAGAITGGTFSEKAKNGTNEALIAEDYKLVENADGTYGVQASYVAQIGETKYETIADAITAAQAGETVTLLDNAEITEKFSLTDVNIDLNGKTLYLKTTGNYVVNTVKISNGTIDISGGTAENGKSYFTVGGQWAVDGSVLTLDNVNLTGKDYASEWAVICVHNDTILNMTNCVVSLENDLGKAGGFLKDTSGNGNTATINISNTELTLTNIDRGFTGAKVTLDTVDLTITGGEHGINGSELTVKDSTVSISNGTGRGITLNKFNSSIENSEITLTNMGEGGIRFKTANQLTVDENSTLSATTAHADVAGATINNVAVTGTEDNMSNVTVSENVTTVENPVYLAQIGDNKYTTLADAITAAKAGDTIVITDNIVLETGVVVGADMNITIDLNGYTVSMVDSSSATVAMIKNNGTLTITDNSEAKTGKISFNTTTPSAANAYASNTISNYGTLVVENGTIENTSTGSACYAIDGYANSTTIINGGYMSATKTAVRVFDWTTGSNTSLKIAGGHIYSAAGYAVNFNMGNTPAVSFEVTGGTLETADTTYNLAVYVASKGSAENVTINVTNGEFLGNFALNGVTSTTMSEGNVAITGGTFDGGVICYGTPAYGFVSGGTFTESFDEVALADGYVLESTENGYAPEVATLEDIITFKGYSISENGVGVTAGYTVDKALFEKYCQENGEINLGVVFAATQIDANAIYKSFAGLDLTTNYNVSLKDMKAEHLDLAFVMALYVEANGTKQFVTADETGATVLVESTQVEAITYNSVAGQTKEDNE